MSISRRWLGRAGWIGFWVHALLSPAWGALGLQAQPVIIQAPEIDAEVQIYNRAAKDVAVRLSVQPTEYSQGAALPKIYPPVSTIPAYGALTARIRAVAAPEEQGFLQFRVVVAPIQNADERAQTSGMNFVMPLSIRLWHFGRDAAGTPRVEQVRHDGHCLARLHNDGGRTMTLTGYIRESGERVPAQRDIFPRDHFSFPEHESCVAAILVDKQLINIRPAENP